MGEKDEVKEEEEFSESAPRDSAIGTTVDNRYQVLEVIGRGGSSSVYKAQDSQNSRMVALKLLHNHLASDKEVVERFKREAKAGNEIRHPNVIDVETWSITKGGQVYMVMELVDGVNLQEAIEIGLTQKQVVAIALQICAALTAAHETGVVHRDLKPANIMLTKTSAEKFHVKVLDFGIAKILPINGDTVLKLTQSTNTLGSFLYMSPEQCLDNDVDERSDIYSLACLLYEALTKRPPLVARTVFETMNKQLTEMPAPLNVVCPSLPSSKQIEKVLFKALAKDPNKRYQSVREFQLALAAITEEHTDSVPPTVQPPIVPQTNKQTTNQVSQANLNTAAVTSTESTNPTTDEIKQQLFDDLQKEPNLDILAYIINACFAAVCFYLCAEAYEVAALKLLAMISLIIAICFFSLLVVMLLNPQKHTPTKEYSMRTLELLPYSIEVLSIEMKRLDHFFVVIKSEGDQSQEKLEFAVAPAGKQKDMWVKLAMHALSERSQNSLSKELHKIADDQHNPEKTNGRQSTAVSLSFPLDGYLFYDCYGKPVALSIQSAIGWIRQE